MKKERNYTMKKFSTTILMLVLVMAVAACGSGNNNANNSNAGASNAGNANNGTQAAAPADAAPTTVEITDNYGTVTVPVNPQNVVSLDNRTFETLSDWGIKLAAAPKAVMPADSPYVSDDSVQDIGNHREPNLEIIAAVN